MVKRKANKLNLITALKCVGLKNLLLNFNSLFSIIFIITLSILYIKGFVRIDNIVDFISGTIATIAGALLGIVIAGLAIIIAILNTSILEALESSGKLDKILYPFYLVSLFWALTLTISLILKIIVYPLNYNDITFVVICFNIIFFNFSLYCTVDLIKSTIRIIKTIAK